MWYQDRCRDCIYLYEGDHGEWVCDYNGEDCEVIPDSDCPAEVDFMEDEDYE